MDKYLQAISPIDGSSRQHCQLSINEVKDDFLLRKKEGYYCRYGDFYIDAARPVPVNLISHAHGDHATAGHGNMFATAATFAFMRNKFPKMPEKTLHPVGFGETFRLGDVEVDLIPAGHMLGSAQIRMRYGGATYLYTGDCKLQPDPTCEPIRIVPADVLITESTFADPNVRHPDPRTEILKLRGRPANILLGCYALGKAQRLTALINEHLPGREVLVHPKILPLHRLYDRHGFAKLNYAPYNRKALKDGSANKIYLVPPLTFNGHFRAGTFLKAFASGWERLQNRNDIALYISDHVDWQDILDLVEQVKPQQIWTVHGDGRHLRRHFEGKLIVRDMLEAIG